MTSPGPRDRPPSSGDSAAHRSHVSVVLHPNGAHHRPDGGASIKQTPVPIPRPVGRPPKQTPVPLPHIPESIHRNPMMHPQRIPPKQTPVPVPARPAPATAHRGRPKGWKPGMSYAEMRGNPTPRAAKPKPGQMGVAKRRGRPPRQASPSPRQLYLSHEVSFVSFICEWFGCKAELHNLETLRRHVRVVHIQRGRGCCRWGRRCGDAAPRFETVEGVEEHFEKVHLLPFSWHVGDGPKCGLRVEKGPEVPGYLKDAGGNQVTPSVKDQEVEDYATWRDNRRRLKELLMERDRNLPSGDEDEDEDEDEESTDELS